MYIHICVTIKNFGLIHVYFLYTVFRATYSALISKVTTRAWEPANFLAAPAPDFFFKRLRLLVFSQAAPAPAPRVQKTGSGS